MRQTRFRENHYCSVCRATTTHQLTDAVQVCIICGHTLHHRVWVVPSQPKVVVQLGNSSHTA